MDYTRKVAVHLCDALEIVARVVADHRNDPAAALRTVRYATVGADRHRREAFVHAAATIVGSLGAMVHTGDGYPQVAPEHDPGPDESTRLALLNAALSDDQGTVNGHLSRLGAPELEAFVLFCADVADGTLDAAAASRGTSREHLRRALTRMEPPPEMATMSDALGPPPPTWRDIDIAVPTEVREAAWQQGARPVAGQLIPLLLLVTAELYSRDPETAVDGIDGLMRPVLAVMDDTTVSVEERTTLLNAWIGLLLGSVAALDVAEDDLDRLLTAAHSLARTQQRVPLTDTLPDILELVRKDAPAARNIALHDPYAAFHTCAVVLGAAGSVLDDGFGRVSYAITAAAAGIDRQHTDRHHLVPRTHGADRNRPCRCGSGRKAKRCCGS